MQSTDEKTAWFVTDAGRGLGADIAKAALAAFRDLSTALAPEASPCAS